MPHRSAPGGEGMVHGIDERISLENLRFGIGAMHEIVRKLAVE